MWSNERTVLAQHIAAAPPPPEGVWQIADDSLSLK
jgi:hypothetical protein